MKETYRIPRPPEIACNGNHFDSSHSEELLSLLGFCISETPVVNNASEEETQALDSVTTLCSTFDDSDHMDETDPILTPWEEFSVKGI